MTNRPKRWRSNSSAEPSISITTLARSYMSNLCKLPPKAGFCTATSKMLIRIHGWDRQDRPPFIDASRALRRSTTSAPSMTSCSRARFASHATGIGGIMRKRIIIGLLVLPAFYFVSGEKNGATPTLHVTSERKLEPGLELPMIAPEGVNYEINGAPNVSAPLPRSSPSSEKSVSAGRKFVRGNSVALRGGPGTNFPILDRYETGRSLDAFGVDGEWTRVRDVLTQREGWISSHLLSNSKPDAPKKEESKPKPDQSPLPSATPPLLSESLIIQRLIAASIASYPGACPCPESRDRAGRRCGNRSAWAKGGGYAPLCYTNDITPAMITAFRSRQ